MTLTATALAEALCAAMPHDGGGSRLVYEDALEAAQKAIGAMQTIPYAADKNETARRVEELYRATMQSTAHLVDMPIEAQILNARIVLYEVGFLDGLYQKAVES